MMDFEGIEALTQRLATLTRQAVPAAVDAIDAETELVLFHSQPLVPVLSGALLASGHPVHAQVSGEMVSGEVRYGAGLDYAARVHFDASMNHPRGGQSHFLQQPFFEATADMLQHFAEHIRQHLGG